MTPRVAHVITKLVVGGAQETALSLCRHLERVEPVLVAGRDEPGDVSLRGEAAAAGVTVVDAPELQRPIRPLADARAVGALARRLAGLDVDLVHTHSSKAGLVGRLAAHRLGLPAVHTVHGWSFTDATAPALRAVLVRAERAAARRSAALVVVARPDRDKGLAHGIGRPDQYHLIRSGIDLDALRPPAGARARVRAELGVADDVPLVGAVGRLAEQKDPLTLLSAVELLPGTHLAWVGDGPLRAEVEAEVARRGLGGRVHLLGARRDVPDVLAALDAFALASRWEGLPRTLTEAMAVGVPAVATAVDGCVEIVEPHRNGLLVPPGDPRALADAVASLLADRAGARRLAAAARATVEAWSERAMVEATDDLYDRVLAREGAPTGPGDGR